MRWLLPPMTMDKGNLYTVADIGLADEGALRVDWARSRMPVLAALKEQAEKEESERLQVIAKQQKKEAKEAEEIKAKLEAAGAKVELK